MPVKVNPWDVGVKPRIVHLPGRMFCQCYGADISVFGPTPAVAYEKWQNVRAAHRKMILNSRYGKLSHPLAWPRISNTPVPKTI